MESRHGGHESVDSSGHAPPSDWDLDSALGDEDYDDMDMSSTASLTSSVVAYRDENGRRYHAFRDGQYFMPNDDLEQQAMQMMHHISQVVLHGALFRSPVTAPMNILEIGTGVGQWAIDVADMFPAASVIATDLSAIQPSWVPPNLEFQLDDCESAWDFDREFDFIHMRNLSGSIADWPNLLAQCYRHLKPGGWLEVASLEIAIMSANEGGLPEDSASAYWVRCLTEAAARAGRQLNVTGQIKSWQEEAGLVDVYEECHTCPMSNWLRGRRKLSAYVYWFVDAELEATSLRLFTRFLGWEPERLLELLVKVREEISNPDNKMYSTMHYVCGRKPNVV